MPEQNPHDLLMVTAQLIEAACRARDGDSYGTRAHCPCPRIWIRRRRIEVAQGLMLTTGAIEERVTELAYPGRTLTG